MATYCRFEQLDISSLPTQQEVGVFRTRQLDPNKLTDVPQERKDKLHAASEYKSIPWNTRGKSSVNFSLAIWALACLGMNDNHCEMEGPDDSPRHWTEWRASPAG